MVESVTSKRAFGKDVESNPMNTIISLLKPITVTASLPSGQVFVIRAIPDLFTGEVINVGACVVLPNGQRLTKVIDAPGRLECMYGDAAHEIVLLAKQAKYCAQHSLPSPALNIIFDHSEPYYNLSPEQALDGFFSDWVTVAATKTNVQTSIPSFTTEDARREVLNVIKRLRPIAAINPLIPENPNLLINIDEKNRLVDVPLQPNFGAGTIESVDYGASTIRFHLLERITDLAAVHRAGKASRLGMFIVRPQGIVSEKKLREIDNAIDKVLWKIPSNMRVEVDSSIERTAQSAIEWADEVASSTH